MKRVLSAIITISFIVAGTEVASAWFWDKAKEEKPASATEPQKQEAAKPASKAPAQKAAEKAKPDAEKKAAEARKAKRELVEKKRIEIDAMEWNIQLSPLTGKAKKLTDTAVFKDGQVSFKEFGKKGFAPSNFSLKIQEDNVLVWETMQTAEKAGVAFWRGEISPNLDTMRGVLSHRIDEKTKEDYSFVSTAVNKSAQAEKK